MLCIVLFFELYTRLCILFDIHCVKLWQKRKKDLTEKFNLTDVG